jgi:hypothetical protein
MGDGTDAGTRTAPGTAGRHDTDRYVVYQDCVKVNGTRAWRNNNPGNIRGGTFTNDHGAIGSDSGPFGIFPDEATGAAALDALLRTDTYQNGTLADAIYRYAPPNENNTENYLQMVEQRTGVPRTTPMNQLNDDQLAALAGAIRQIEGWQEGTVYNRGDDNLPDWVAALLGP